jgi:transcriptional regulator GlxA family with amidase domain
MLGGGLPIGRVAERSGFSSAHHLRRVWRRVNGSAPRDRSAAGRSPIATHGAAGG